MTLKRTPTLQLAILCLTLVVLLLPFVGKAFHIDDPLFIWTARHLLDNPFNFYGFDVNWYGTVEPISGVMKNPPLFSYYLALVGGVAGWSETVLHLACLVPALAVGTGTWLLARELEAEPLPAALLGLLSPVFLLSATTVMCDVPLTAFWVWSLYLWLKGSATDDWRRLLLAVALAGAAAMTKYFGVCLIPLLALHAVAEGGRGRKRLVYLLLPVLVLAGYQFLTRSFYGVGLLTDAAGYSAKMRRLTPAGLLTTLLTGLSYAGGCLLPLLLAAPRVWKWRSLPVMAALAITALLLVVLPQQINGFRPGLANGLWLPSGLLVLFVAAGLGLLVLAAIELRDRRDSGTLLLVAWIGGTFLFAACFNWTVSGRNILPMAPAAGILLARRFIPPAGTTVRDSAILVLTVLLSVAVSLSIIRADAAIAGAARLAATELAGRYGQGGNKMYFQGHWGFQYYMQQLGAWPIDFKRAAMAEGDVMVIPSYGTNVRMTSTAGFVRTGSVSLPLCQAAATMDPNLGAGFYMSQKAALPYAFGRVNPAPAQFEVFLFDPSGSANSAR